MGYNTTVVILNDALEDIANDPFFGKKLRDAVLKVGAPCDNQPVEISCNGKDAARVIETHHANVEVLVSVGSNTGIVVDFVWGSGVRRRRLLKKSAQIVGADMVTPPAIAARQLDVDWIPTVEDGK